MRPGMWVTSRTGSVGWDLRKVRVEFSRPKKTVDFRSSPRPYGVCRTWFGWGGADGKVVIERLCLSLPYVEKPFNSKVKKSFVPELRSRKCFFYFVSGFQCNLYMSYEHSIYVSRVRILAVFLDPVILHLYRPSPHDYVPWGKCTLGIQHYSSCLVRPRGIPLFFYIYSTPHQVINYSYLIRLVTSCCGCLRY